jgi:hypothetical protein
MVIPRKICGYSKDHLLSSSDYGLVLSINLVLNFCLRPYTLVSAGGAHHLYVSALARPPAVRWLGSSERRFRLAKWSLCRG